MLTLKAIHIKKEKNIIVENNSTHTLGGVVREVGADIADHKMTQHVHVGVKKFTRVTGRKTRSVWHEILWFVATRVKKIKQEISSREVVGVRSTKHTSHFLSEVMRHKEKLEKRKHF